MRVIPRVARPLLIGAGLLSFTACQTVYGPSLVTSRTASSFYYMRTDIWIQHRFDDPVKLNAPGALVPYGPFQIGDRLPFDVGQQYVFVPICAGHPKGESAVRHIMRAGEPINIEC